LPTQIEALLEVQDHDTRLDQLRHQLAELPARTERDEAREALSGVSAAIEAAEAERADLSRDQRRLDDEIETLSTKRKQEETALYGGAITNARELQDLQEEITSIGRRITQLEDRDLEFMEKIEPIDASLAELATRRATATEVLAGAEQRLIAAEAELAVALEQAEAARSSIAGEVPADLLAEYEALRVGNGGVGVARLTGSQCGGCHLGLSAVELSRVRKMGPGEVTHCEECGRLLVA